MRYLNDFTKLTVRTVIFYSSGESKAPPQKKEKEKKIELFSYQISHLQLQDCNVFFFAFRLEIKEIVVSES